MATQPDARRWTFEEYFAWEELQPDRHEYVRGEVYAMSGGTLRHARVSTHLINILGNALSGHRCEVFLGTIKLRIAAADCSYYPDVLINCAPDEIEARGVVNDATAVFEVLSPSTAANDKGEKLEDYQTLPSLQHYVLIDPNALTVEVFDRSETGWSYRKLRGDVALALPAVGIDLPLSQLFDGVGEAVAPIGRPVGMREDALQWLTPPTEH